LLVFIAILNFPIGRGSDYLFKDPVYLKHQGYELGKFELQHH